MQGRRATRKAKAIDRAGENRRGAEGIEQGAAPGRILANIYVQILLIALVGLAAYSNTFHVPFTFDDEPSIKNNPAIQDLAGFLDGAGYAYNPRRFVGYLTFALNYRLGGLEVAGYHAVNLAIHIATALLVLALARLTFGTPFFGDREETQTSPFTVHHSLVPLLAALLFVSHPIQTQAVTYIVQRLASLATMFYLASLVLYVKGRLALRNRQAGSSSPVLRSAFFFLFSLVAAGLALRTKETAFTLPFVVVLYEFSFFGASLRKRLLLLLPVFLVIAALPLVALHGDKSLGDILSDVSRELSEARHISRGEYLLTQFSVIATYIRLLFIPAGQNLDYDYPVYDTLFTPRVLLSFLFLCAILGMAGWLYWRSYQGKLQNAKCKVQSGDDKNDFAICNLQSALCIPGAMRLAAFGVFWFFITLSVESSVIPITDVIFEHRLYLPAVGAFIAAGSVLAMASSYSPRGLLLGGGALVILLSAVTWNRNMVWGDELALWADVARKSPEKSRPHVNLGTILKLQGKREEALAEYQAALRINPADAQANYNVGNIYHEMGLLDRAIDQYRAAIAAKPDYARAYNNLGLACKDKGMLREAIEYYKKSIELKPDLPQTHNNLGIACRMAGLIDDAIAAFERAATLQPDFGDAHYNLGVAYDQRGWLDKAIEQYMIVVRLKPDDGETHNRIGIARGMRGETDLAIRHFQTAVALDPGNPDYRSNLAHATRARGVTGKTE